MDHPADLTGKIPETKIHELFSSVIKSGFTECHAVLLEKGFTRTIKIRENRIVFIHSDDPSDTFYDYLRSNSGLSKNDLKEAHALSEKNGIRLGKSLCELNIIDYREMWQYVLDHQNHILNKICDMEAGEYSFYESMDDVCENIILDIPVSKVILKLIRRSDLTESVNEKLEIVNKIFIKERDPELPDDIFSYEKHILSLCIKYRDIDTILQKSELKESDTLKYIYYFSLIDVISTEKTGVIKDHPAKDHISVNISFSSYEEA